MKILLLTTHLDVGGISVYVVNLARSLKKRGHEPVVVSAGGWLESRLVEEGITHYRVPCRTSSELNPKLWTRVFPQMFRIIRKEKPDLMHAHTRIMQVVGSIAGRLMRIPFVTTCHGLYRYRVGRRLFRGWGRWVIAISGPTMNRLVEQYKLAPPHRVVLIPNGVELDWFSQPAPKASVQTYRQAMGLKNGPIIGGIARLSPVKGFDLLLEAIPPLLKSFPDLQLLLVGDGPVKEELIQQAFRLGIADRVVVSHPVADVRIPMALIDLFVAPALEEGFGLSIVEAMAAGKPVIVSDSGGPGEIVDGGKCGVLIPPGDVEAITRAVRDLLENPEQQKQLGRAGQVRARQKYDFNRVVSQVEEVYERV